mgnify:CR=1 FL=1
MFFMTHYLFYDSSQQSGDWHLQKKAPASVSSHDTNTGVVSSIDCKPYKSTFGMVAQPFAISSSVGMLSDMTPLLYFS